MSWFRCGCKPRLFTVKGWVTLSGFDGQKTQFLPRRISEHCSNIFVCSYFIYHSRKLDVCQRQDFFIRGFTLMTFELYRLSLGPSAYEFLFVRWYPQCQNFKYNSLSNIPSRNMICIVCQIRARNFLSPQRHWRFLSYQNSLDSSSYTEAIPARYLRICLSLWQFIFISIRISLIFLWRRDSIASTPTTFTLIA